ncbi:alpha/beta hydrolase [Frankia sp. AgB1.9]|uniref:alpha/beta hydrolase n=1 Tax=unclassified Frankia TaxID=2632575 RepID=UPI00193477AA|nr:MULTISPECIES: alpha/beta hydrolase [unclassified Frankia]MBL7550644.1 alpha/beta hydrolase [Frankia sp. AgB1.9]MBL7620981.1 alpha/beta hydrolase [Frankia sp. AgB1.8]
MPYQLDPELAAVVSSVPTVDLSDLPATRLQMKQMFADLAGEVDTSGVAVHEKFVPGPVGAPDVRLLVYLPERRALPSLLFDVHGGAFVVGDADIGHSANIELARDLGVAVVSVDYRLAPEAPFPAGLEDCYAALTWCVKNSDDLGIDPTRVVIHGASAGGGLCAALALLARGRGGPAIAFQFLAIPELDDRLDTPSMRRFIDTPHLNRSNTELSWDYYLGPGVRGTEGVSIHAAPARATDLTGLPPAYISAMEFDPLRDEAIAYAQALLAADVPVELHLFPGTFHGSAAIRHAAVSRREAAEARDVLARALGVEPS